MRAAIVALLIALAGCQTYEKAPIPDLKKYCEDAATKARIIEEAPDIGKSGKPPGIIIPEAKRFVKLGKGCANHLFRVYRETKKIYEESQCDARCQIERDAGWMGLGAGALAILLIALL